MFVSLNAFGQQITIPYSYISVGTLNQAMLTTLGNQAAAAIQSAPAGRDYTVGVAGVLNGIEHGTPIDYSYESVGITRSYAFRLPAGGSTGWDVPETQISAICSETFRGFLVLARNVGINA